MNQFEDKDIRATAFDMNDPADQARVKDVLQRAFAAMDHEEHRALFASVSTIGLMHLRVARLNKTMEQPTHAEFVSILDDPEHPLHRDMMIVSKQSILLVEMFQRLVHAEMRKETPYKESTDESITP